MKRLISVLSILVLVCTMISPVFAEPTTGDVPVDNLGVGGDIPEYDPENERVNEEKLAQIEEAKKNGLYRTLCENASVSCTTRQQITTYWCGLASAEQVIRASGNSNNLTATYGSVPYTQGGSQMVTGSYHQITISNYLGGVTGGVEANKIAKAINHFSTGSYTWSYMYISSNGVTAGRAVLECARHTISDNSKCCVIFADTYYYSYYNGHRCYHWVTLRGYSYQVVNPDPDGLEPIGDSDDSRPSRDQAEIVSFSVVDPHYNSTYSGHHTVQSFYSMGMAIERTQSKPNIVW